MRKHTLLTFDPMAKHPSYTSLSSLFVVDLVVGHRLQQGSPAQPPLAAYQYWPRLVASIFPFLASCPR